MTKQLNPTENNKKPHSHNQVLVLSYQKGIVVLVFVDLV